MEHVVAAIDFSEISDQVVDLAARIAESFSASLWLVHVAAPDPDFVGYGAGPQSVRDSRARELHSEHRELQRMASEVRNRDVEVQALLLQGPTVETLLDEARRLAADLLVVGSHGRGALYRALLGSVSEGLRLRATCPMLVIPARQGES